MVKFRTELLELMFLRKKALITFLGYQRAIDENIKVIALLLIIAWRRVQVIDRRLLENRTMISPVKNNSILGVTISELEGESNTSVRIDESSQMNLMGSKHASNELTNTDRFMVKVSEIPVEEEEDVESESMASRPS